MAWFVFSGGCPSNQKMTLSRKSFHENCILKAPGLAQCLLKAEFCLTLSSEMVVIHSHSLGTFAGLCCYFPSLFRASVNSLLCSYSSFVTVPVNEACEGEYWLSRKQLWSLYVTECRGWQTCANGKNLLPCIPVPLNQLLKSSVSPVGGAPGALGGELCEAALLLCFWFSKKPNQLLFISKREKKELYRGSVCLGLFFFTKVVKAYEWKWNFLCWETTSSLPARHGSGCFKSSGPFLFQKKYISLNTS